MSIQSLEKLLASSILNIILFDQGIIANGVLLIPFEKLKIFVPFLIHLDELLFELLRGKTIYVAIHVFIRQFVVVDQDRYGQLFANQIQVWEKYTVHLLGEKRFTIKVSNQHYTSAMIDRQNQLVAQAENIEAWKVYKKEKFHSVR